MRNIKFLFGILFFPMIVTSQQTEIQTWNLIEIKNYKTLKNLAEYVSNKQMKNISKEVLFDKYIYFDNVLNDTVLERKNKRMNAFDGLFKSIPKTLDSIGLENLDVKPFRFYKNSRWQGCFTKHRQKHVKDIFVYYKKNKPEEPLGLLLMDPETNKLVSWVYLKQGDHSGFFLTFNLL